MGSWSQQVLHIDKKNHIFFWEGKSEYLVFLKRNWSHLKPLFWLLNIKKHIWVKSCRTLLWNLDKLTFSSFVFYPRSEFACCWFPFAKGNWHRLYQKCICIYVTHSVEFKYSHSHVTCVIPQSQINLSNDDQSINPIISLQVVSTRVTLLVGTKCRWTVILLLHPSARTSSTTTTHSSMWVHLYFIKDFPPPHIKHQY